VSNILGLNRLQAKNIFTLSLRLLKSTNKTKITKFAASVFIFPSIDIKKSSNYKPEPQSAWSRRCGVRTVQFGWCTPRTSDNEHRTLAQCVGIRTGNASFLTRSRCTAYHSECTELFSSCPYYKPHRLYISRNTHALQISNIWTIGLCMRLQWLVHM